MVLVSCGTVASSADNSVSFYPQPSPRAEGQGPGRPVFTFFAFFVGKDSPVTSHKCVYSSKTTKGVRNK